MDGGFNRIQNRRKRMTAWTPISEFHPELVGENQQLAVWIENEIGDGEAFMAQIGGMSIANEEGCEPIELPEDAIVGEWRAIPELSHLEPVAFALIDAYEPAGEAHEPVEAETVLASAA
jgi:hypothetical protein